MSKIDDGGTAFPTEYDDRGLTMRDYFAAAANEEDLEMMIFQHRKIIEDTDYGPVYKNPTRAQCRYLFADAMLAARKEGA
jgi:hypothetical protein